MRLRAFLTAMMITSSLAGDAAARKIAGVTMPERLGAGDTALILNGAGVRTKLLLDIYAAGLYLKAASADGAKIVAADEPMALRLHIVSGLITPKDFEEATRDGFHRATGGNVAPIRDRMEKFIAIFREGIAKHDVYDLVYVPGKGVSVTKNGTLKTTASGLDFKQALFGIWLGPRAANPKLRQELLGAR